ncbi:MAG: fibronectin type III domain-containing protein [Brevinemataceae bacterium]
MNKSRFLLLLVAFFLQTSCSKSYIQESVGLVNIPLDIPQTEKSEGVFLHWKAGWEFDRFEVYRSERKEDLSVPKEEFLLNGNIRRQSFLDETAQINKTFYYKVVGYTFRDHPLGSSEIAFGKRGMPELVCSKIPESLIVSQGEFEDKINVYWKYSVSSGVLFRVYRKKADVFEVIADVFERSYTDKNLDPNQRYEYKVAVIGKDKTGKVVEYSTDSVEGFTFGVPSNFEVVSFSHNPAGSIYLTWDFDPKMEYYQVFRSRSELDGYELIMPSVFGGTFTDMGLPCVKGTGSGKDFRYPTYYYKIRSVANNLQQSDLTLPILGQAVDPDDVLPDPKNLKVNKPFFGNTWKINWSAVPGASGYRIYRKSATQSDWFDVQDISGTTFQDNLKGPFLSSVSAGTEVTYQIQALNINKGNLPVGIPAVVSTLR